MYFNWDTGGWATVVKDSGYYLLNKVFSYSVLVMMALAFWNIKRSKKKLWDEKLENYFAIYFFVIIACFLCKRHHIKGLLLCSFRMELLYSVNM